MERNTLMATVYPKLKEYCREKHGLEFQVSWINFDYFSLLNSKNFRLLTCDGVSEMKPLTITWPPSCVWKKSTTVSVYLWVLILWYDQLPSSLYVNWLLILLGSLGISRPEIRVSSNSDIYFSFRIGSISWNFADHGSRSHSTRYLVQKRFERCTTRLHSPTNFFHFGQL